MSNKIDKELMLKKIKLHYGFKKEVDFAKFLGIKPQTLNTWYARNTFDFEILYAKCLDLSPNWLLSGIGEMIKKNVKIMDENLFITVPLVSQYAQAGYLSGFSDAEYIDQLPTIPFVIPEGDQPKGKYLAFEVRGDSMNDGSDRSILEHDILLARHIKPELYANSKLHINRWFFVIVHKDSGILVKQITRHDVENGIITVHSLNSYYEDVDLNLKDVAELYNVVQYLRKPKPAGE